MEMTRRSALVYVLLAAVWALVVAWQVEEHLRVREAARADLRASAKAVAKTLSASIRGMTFRGTVRQEQLEGFLNELVKARTDEPVKSSEIFSVYLLNAAGVAVAYAGKPIDLEQKDLVQEGERWGQHSVTLINPVDLGATLSVGTTNPTFVLPPRSDLTNRPPDPGRRTNAIEETNAPNPATNSSFSAVSNASSEVGSNTSAAEFVLTATNGSGSNTVPTVAREGRRRGPWWVRLVDPSLREKRSLHGLVLSISNESLLAASTRDLWLRSIILALATFSVVGSCLIWRNLAKTSELQIRLVRASELNTHLKEMNLAAAGLAHETRNPLNIIRGLAQMISKQPETGTETRQKTREILNETDKVTAQLNEFINYARPREIRRSRLDLNSVIGEVVRALNYDLEEKKIRLQVKGDQLSIEADEQLLRQALFNLLLNATQAAEQNGEIEVVAAKRDSAAILEVRDNGPGVPADRRTEIFKPYFTTQKQGTGLGLAVVQQIVLAHGWEIECLPNQPKGAIFRVSHLKLAS